MQAETETEAKGKGKGEIGGGKKSRRQMEMGMEAGRRAAGAGCRRCRLCLWFCACPPRRRRRALPLPLPLPLPRRASLLPSSLRLAGGLASCALRHCVLCLVSVSCVRTRRGAVRGARRRALLLVAAPVVFFLGGGCLRWKELGSQGPGSWRVGPRSRQSRVWWPAFRVCRRAVVCVWAVGCASAVAPPLALALGSHQARINGCCLWWCCVS